MDRSAFAAEYAASSEERLVDLARGYDGLVPDAQEALRSEFARRGLLPPLLAERQDGEHQLVTVRRFRDLTEALVVKSLLESAGLLCFLQDENMVRLDWAYSNALGGMRLQVPDDQVAAAEELLRQTGEEVGTDDEPRCPKCRSFDVKFSRTGHGAALVSLFLFSVPLPRGKKVWQCEQCGTQWTDSEEGQAG